MRKALEDGPEKGTGEEAEAMMSPPIEDKRDSNPKGTPARSPDSGFSQQVTAAAH